MNNFKIVTNIFDENEEMAARNWACNGDKLNANFNYNMGNRLKCDWCGIFVFFLSFSFFFLARRYLKHMNIFEMRC